MTRLFRAAEVGDIASVRAYLDQGDDPNIRCGDSYPLHAAITSIISGVADDSAIAIANLLIAHRANVNMPEQDLSQLTPLHWAAESQWPEMIEILLNAGAIVDARSSMQDTPLMLVCMGRVQAQRETTERSMRLLLRAGADIHARDRIGSGPLIQCPRHLRPILQEYAREGVSHPAPTAFAIGLKNLLGQAKASGLLVTSDSDSENDEPYPHAPHGAAAGVPPMPVPIAHDINHAPEGMPFGAFPPAAGVAPSVCSVCAKTTTQRCGRCKKIYYCSQECQRRVWATHKLTCLPAP